MESQECFGGFVLAVFQLFLAYILKGRKILTQKKLRRFLSFVKHFS